MSLFALYVEFLKRHGLYLFMQEVKPCAWRADRCVQGLFKDYHHYETKHMKESKNPTDAEQE